MEDMLLKIILIYTLASISGIASGWILAVGYMNQKYQRELNRIRREMLDYKTQLEENLQEAVKAVPSPKIQ